MKMRKTVKVAMGATCSKNKFMNAKLSTFVAKSNQTAQCEKAAKDFEEYLYNNCAAQFYNTLRDNMNGRVKGE